jgi:hypothetical protein
MIRGLARVAVIFVAVSGCSDATGVRDNRFTLTSVMGRPLPVEYREFDFLTPDLEITAGSIELRDDGTFTEEHHLRCRDPLPPDVIECSLQSERLVREGTYSAAERWLQFGERRFDAQFDPDRVLIEYGLSPARPILFIYEK